MLGRFRQWAGLARDGGVPQPPRDPQSVVVAGRTGTGARVYRRRPRDRRRRVRAVVTARSCEPGRGVRYPGRPPGTRRCLGVGPSRRRRAAAATARGRGTAPARHQAQSRPRRVVGVAPLRRRQRVLPDFSRSEHGVFVRVLGRDGRRSGRRAARQARPGVPQTRLTAGDATARCGLWVGVDGDPRCAPLRRRRGRRDAEPRTGGVGTESRSGGGPVGSARVPCPGLPRCRRRAVRRDLEYRDVGARRGCRAAHLRRHTARTVAATGSAAEPRHRRGQHPRSRR